MLCLELVRPLGPKLDRRDQLSEKYSSILAIKKSAMSIHGFTLMLCKETQRALIEREYNRSGIITASFKTSKIEIKRGIILLYTTINDSNDDKDQFIEKLRSMLEN